MPRLPRAKVKPLTFHVERFLERVASPEFVAEQAQPRRTIYLSGSGKSGLKRLLAIRPKIVPRGFCKPRGDLNQDSTRKKSAEGSTWNWLRGESRIASIPDEVLDGLARGYKNQDSREVRCESVQAFHVEHVKLCASRFRAADKSLLSFQTSPLGFARWTLCSTWNVSGLLKWVRKCWPIDCYASPQS